MKGKGNSMKKTFEYRAYPTTKQRNIFTVWLALLRSVYNQALAWRIEAYEAAGLTVSCRRPENQEHAQEPLPRQEHIDAGWGSFRLKLQSKAANAGKQFTEVKPHYTSQKCSSCNEVVPKKLSVRTHDCPYCGLVIDRDHNAAINIKKAAVALRGGVVVAHIPRNPCSDGDRSA